MDGITLRDKNLLFKSIDYEVTLNLAILEGVKSGDMTMRQGILTIVQASCLIMRIYQVSWSSLIIHLLCNISQANSDESDLISGPLSIHTETKGSFHIFFIDTWFSSLLSYWTVKSPHTLNESKHCQFISDPMAHGQLEHKNERGIIEASKHVTTRKVASVNLIYIPYEPTWLVIKMFGLMGP